MHLKRAASFLAIAKGLVVFAHGSGSSRLSKRNRYVATYLHHHHVATLLFDLLTEEEDKFYQNRFNIDLLTERLVRATEWVLKQRSTQLLKLAYFGASTGAASALKASTIIPAVGAIVCRGGRPDLVLDYLPSVTAPTLLIVGENDPDVLRLNELALNKLRCSCKLSVVAGATHLFEEEGALEQVCMMATQWYHIHLGPRVIENIIPQVGRYKGF